MSSWIKRISAGIVAVFKYLIGSHMEESGVPCSRMPNSRISSVTKIPADTKGNGLSQDVVSSLSQQIFREKLAERP